MREEIVPGDRSKYFAKVNTRVSTVAKKRVQFACAERARKAARVVTEGEILNELAMEYLPPHPAELAAGNGDRPERKHPKQEGRKRVLRTAAQG